MTTSLLVRVRRSYAIHAHRRVRGLLDGEYGSVFKGRSLDFDDLREYVTGDDVKDIDWKASARTGHPLIRRYVAQRKHTIALAVDTSRSMAALNAWDTPKLDLTLTAAGTLAWIAHRHGDLVCLVSGDAERTWSLPAQGSQAHLERVLRHIRDTTTLRSGPPGLLTVLRRASQALKDRCILVVITGDDEIGTEAERALRRLRVRHEILFLVVADVPVTDAALAGHEVRDVDSGGTVPAFIRRNPRLHAELQADDARRRDQRARVLDRLGIASAELSTEPEVVPDLFRLLERHRRARRSR